MRAINWVGLILGCILFYLSFFLYEDEQGQLQNRLEEIWVRIDDLKQNTVSIHIGFTVEVMHFCLKMLHIIWGNKLISIRSIFVTHWILGLSAYLSFAFVYLFNLNFNIYFSSCDSCGYLNYAVTTPFSLFPVLVMTILASLPLVISKWSVIWTIWLIFFTIQTIVTYIFIQEFKLTLPEVVISISSELVAIIFFLIWLRILKLVLTHFSLISARNIITFIFSNVWLICWAFYYQSYIVLLLKGVTYVFGANNITQDMLYYFPRFALLTNTLMFLYPFMIIVIVALLIAHRIFWPFIQRPIYSLQMYKVFENQKLIFICGLVLILFSLGYELSRISEIRKLAP